MKDDDIMSEAELRLFLSTLADLVEVKAETGEEAAKLIREKTDEILKKK